MALELEPDEKLETLAYLSYYLNHNLINFYDLQFVSLVAQNFLLFDIIYPIKFGVNSHYWCSLTFAISKTNISIRVLLSMCCKGDFGTAMGLGNT